MIDIEFKAIDPAIYVNWEQAQWAQKSATVKAEFVESGTVVETVMADGHVETTKTAGQNAAYKVTNPLGEQYLIEPDKFEKLYEKSETEGIFRSKWDPVPVVKVNENVSFTAPWGEEMRIKAGGVLVNGGDNDIYGIQEDEFAATYDIVTKSGEPRPTPETTLKL